MENISNYETYNSGMNKSYLDKIFFLDKIEGVESILDFGCASGDILKHIHEIDKDLKLYGYDNDKNMIEMANDKYSNFAIFESNFEKAVTYLNPETSLLNLSSVIHEVYSYGKLNDVRQFWSRVFNTGFQYISIRDLSVSNTCSRDSSPDDYVRLLNNCHPVMLNDYEDT